MMDSMTTDTETVLPCGQLPNLGEEVWCRKHAAEALGIPIHRVHYYIARGYLVAHEQATAHRYDSCNVRWRGRSLIPIGSAISL